jgi:hypothetical protein
MTMDQLDELKKQMIDYFQITVQAYALEKEAKGAEDPETTYWKKELVFKILDLCSENSLIQKFYTRTDKRN